MILYERFGDRGFHTTVFTTFGIDFDAYENIALARLRGSGCHNNILLADQRMLTHALSGASAMPQTAGRLYSVAGASATGVFHTKIILQLGRRQGRLIIGSANATASGLAGNLELAGVIECDQEESSAQSLIAASWNYLSRLLNWEHRTFAQHLSWLEKRTPWLSRAKSAQGAVTLADGTQADFLVTEGNTGIMDRFIELVSGQEIEQLLILSPYWDSDLSALKELAARIEPTEIFLLIDKDRALFPGTALSGLSGTRILDIGSFADGRFVHAKLIVARAADSDHVLFGSANCTIAALGSQNFAGRNEEACLYRRLPSGAVTANLDLDEVIADAVILESADLPALQQGDELPFDDLASRYPGNFECLFDTLIWQPPSFINLDGVEIELLNADESVLSCSLHRLSQSSETEIHYRISGAKERPAMARLVFQDSTVSAPGIVSLVDALRSEARDLQTKNTERAITQLGEETEEGFWLLEVLDLLEASESEATESISRRLVRKGSDDKEELQYKKLNYEQFVAGRRLRLGRSAVSRNSLSGSELSFVRIFLNRVLALEPADETGEEADEKSYLSTAFDLGDEVADGQDAIERGDDFGAEARVKAAKISAEQEEGAAQKWALQRRANRNQIVNAVKAFNIRISARAREGELTPVDCLRLRAILTVVTAAGWTGMDKQSNKGQLTSLTTLQVLPSVGSDDCWPRLLGQILFTFFGGPKPVIHYLRIDDMYDQVPDDLIECWACCFWTLQACLAATKSERSQSRLSYRISLLRESLYKLTGLTQDELLGDQVTQVMLRMGDRFATRLGLNADMLVSSHRHYVDALAQAKQETHATSKIQSN